MIWQPKLQDIESALYNAAHTAAKQGVKVAPNGEPVPLAAAADNTDPQVAALRRAASDYAETYEAGVRPAKGYRLNAATQLSDLYDQISYQPGKVLNPDQWVTVGDYLRGLYTLPGEKNHLVKGGLPKQIDEARDRMKDSRKALKQARAEYQAKGLKLPAGNDARLGHSSAVKELKGLETDLASAEAGKGELPLTRALNAHLDDIAKEIPQLGALTESLPKGLEFLKDIPVIDVAATGAVAVLQARDDMDKGWSPGHARAVDYGAGAIGLAGGAVVGAAAVTVAAPGILAVGSAGLAAMGIGDFAYQGFHEHWREDVHNDGVVPGVLVDVGHMGENTVKDVGHVATGLWHGAQNGWHSVFG